MTHIEFNTIGRLADRLTEQPGETASPIHRRQGVIANPSNISWANRTVDIILGNSGITIPNVKFLNNVFPVAGGTCWIDFQGPVPTVVAMQGGGGSVTYTPVVDQGVTTDIAKTIVLAEYVRHGNECTVWGDLAMTDGGTAGSAITITLPFNNARTAAGDYGSGQYYRTGTTTRYICILENSGTTNKVVLVNDASSNSAVGNAPSFPIANGDVIRFMAHYLVAAGQ